MLNGPTGYLPPKMPKSVSLPLGSPVRALHLLGGVGGWSFPASGKGSTSMIVRLIYADGTTEDHPLVNGVHMADYIRRVDVPESEFAFDLDGRCPARAVLMGQAAVAGRVSDADQRTSSSSTRKWSVASPGITPPAPRFP